MSDILFLTVEQALEIHAYQVEQFGGEPTVRDLGLLESALAQPQQGFGGQYVHGSLFLMAAAYLFHIARNHPFADGNKRAATHAAILFMAINGIELALDPDEAEVFVVAAAQGQKTKEEIAAFFEAHVAASE